RERGDTEGLAQRVTRSPLPPPGSAAAPPPPPSTPPSTAYRLQPRIRRPRPTPARTSLPLATAIHPRLRSSRGRGGVVRASSLMAGIASGSLRASAADTEQADSV